MVLDPFGNIYFAGTGVLTKYSPAGATLWQDGTGVVVNAGVIRPHLRWVSVTSALTLRADAAAQLASQSDASEPRQGAVLRLPC